MQERKRCFGSWFSEIKDSWDGNVALVPKKIKVLPCGCQARKLRRGGYERFNIVLSPRGVVHHLDSGRECVVMEAQLVPLRIFNERKMIEEPRRMIV